MKTFLLLFIIGLAFVSCSDDNCAEKRAIIIKSYEEGVEFYKDDPERLKWLKEVRDAQLAAAC
jgi:hypothetical protein